MLLLVVAITQEASMKALFRLLREYVSISQRKFLEWMLGLDAEKLPICFPKCLSPSFDSPTSNMKDLNILLCI